MAAGAPNIQLYRPSDGPLTQGFGAKQLQDGNKHAGSDFGYTDGIRIFDKVYAAAEARVIYAGDSRNMGWPNLLYLNIDFDRTDNVDSSAGNYIILGHYDAQGNLLAYTGYGHLEELYVKTGAWVRARQHIAKVGQTGFSYGKHLHFDLVLNPYNVSIPPFYGRVDPTPFFIDHNSQSVEGDLTVAEADRVIATVNAAKNEIIAHINAMLLTGYEWGGRKDNPGLILHTLENQRLIKALPTQLWWGVTVEREGKKVPVIQELANGVTEGLEQTDLIASLAENITPEALAALIPAANAEAFVNALRDRLALTGDTNEQPSTPA